jgi:hypothetical protein
MRMYFQTKTKIVLTSKKLSSISIFAKRIENKKDEIYLYNLI